MNAWLDQCHFGDVRAVLRQMIADGVQVHTIVTSPPYWGLRSYLPADHPDKASEIDSEPTLREFLATMLEVFDLCRQVLRDDGTMWVNMGDSYAGSTGGGAPSSTSTLRGNGHVGGGPKLRSSTVASARPRPLDGLKPKDLVGQPWRLAFALQDAGWWLRQDIVWHKPNPMPESTRDRCTKSHEYIFLLVKSERYYFDQGAIRTPLSPETKAQSFDTMDYKARDRYKMPDGWDTAPGGHGSFHREGREKGKPRTAGNVNPPKGAVAYELGDNKHRTKAGLIAFAERSRQTADHTSTANKRSVWTVATDAYPGSHFATFPRALIEPCILAGAPAGGVVLDIFFGSGTTGQVAQQLGRRFIGIDINRANEPLQRDRLRQPSLALECEA